VENGVRNKRMGIRKLLRYEQYNKQKHSGDRTGLNKMSPSFMYFVRLYFYNLNINSPNLTQDVLIVD
jgi:hypothetical protein